MRAILLTAVLTLAAGPAMTADEPAQSTADATAAQIADFVKGAPPLGDLDDGVAGVTPSEPDRRPHGFVDVAVGSHGYRSVYLESTMPIGKTGSLTVGLGEQRGGYGYPYGYGYGQGPGYDGGAIQTLGVGLALGDAAVPSRPCRAGRPQDEAQRSRDERPCRSPSGLGLGLSLDDGHGPVGGPTPGRGFNGPRGPHRAR